LLWSSLYPCSRHPRDLHSFPTRRSSDLSASGFTGVREDAGFQEPMNLHSTETGRPAGRFKTTPALLLAAILMLPASLPLQAGEVDRKSTRLNSSHVKISYAVFCLKKKKN